MGGTPPIFECRTVIGVLGVVQITPQTKLCLKIMPGENSACRTHSNVTSSNNVFLALQVDTTEYTIIEAHREVRAGLVGRHKEKSNGDWPS